jgi:phosphoglucosamine mutase
MGRIFGTDGVRGEANSELTPELAMRIGQALVTVLREEGKQRPSVLIGRDPRWSGEMLQAALTAGITSAGGDAVQIGVLPTPAVAFLTARGSASAGAMISASHNPVGDNGIKIFGQDGFKLTDEEEDRLEELLTRANAGPRPTGLKVGRRYHDPQAVGRYVEHLVSVADADLHGLTVAVDAANGAASQIAPQVYRHLGARVITTHCQPDGANINDACGSTHPAVIRAAVMDEQADVGIAHDGDADRLIAADANGGEVDGDVILAILARDLKARDTLHHDAVATTVMTNLGFKHAMDRLGIEVVTTQVGDRYVLSAMQLRGLNLGGEQSGHIINLDHSTTGDGILSAVQLLSIVRHTGSPLHELATVMERLPQVLVNVRGVDKQRLDDAIPVWEEIAAVEDELGDDGRVLVRPSGTEPVVRVMVEAPEDDLAQAMADRIANVVERELTPGT